MKRKELVSQVAVLSVRVAELENQQRNHKVVDQPVVISDEEFDKLSARDMSRKMRSWIEAHYKDPDLCPGAVERMFNTPIKKYNRNLKSGNRDVLEDHIKYRKAQMQSDKEKIKVMNRTMLEAVPGDENIEDSINKILFEKSLINISKYFNTLNKEMIHLDENIANAEIDYQAERMKQTICSYIEAEVSNARKVIAVYGSMTRQGPWNN